MRFLNRNFGLILVVLLSIFAIRSFLLLGFFPMHDDTQVARVFEMGKALKLGMFPVRWVDDLGYGYGYPIFNFYAPLAYYIGGFFVLIGFDALEASKIMMVLGILLAGVFMYIFAREFWGKIGGLVSALFYMYAPYHAVDIYVRGDVAEFWAYAFIPLTFFGFYKIYRENNLSYVLVGSLGFAGVILSHNLTAMMLTPFLLIAILLNCYIVPKGKKLLILYYSSLILFLGLAVSAFYWVPALAEMKYTNVLSQIGGGADFRDHFVCIQQLWNSSWGFGGSAKSCIDGMSLMIGKLHIFSVFSLISILIYLKLKSKYFNDIYHLSIFCITGFIISIFLMLGISKFLWEAIPVMAFFQYPWRFLILASFFSSFLAGAVVFLSSQFKVKPYLTAFLLVFFLLFFNIKLFVPQTIFPAAANDFTNEKALKWTTSKISDEYMPKNFDKPKGYKDIVKDRINVVKGNARISNITEDKGIRALVQSLNVTTLRINMAYFPFWKVYIDDKSTPVKKSNSGFLIDLPKGFHKIDIKYEQTPIEKTANMVSLVSIAIVIIGIIAFANKRLRYE